MQFLDRVTEKPNTYRVTNNADGTITLARAEGVVKQEGTKLDALNLNQNNKDLVDEIKLLLDKKASLPVKPAFETKTVSYSWDGIDRTYVAQILRVPGTLYVEVRGCIKIRSGFGWNPVNLPVEFAAKDYVVIPGAISESNANYTIGVSNKDTLGLYNVDRSPIHSTTRFSTSAFPTTAGDGEMFINFSASGIEKI